MSKSYWDVKIPEEGDLTREQGWAALSRIGTSLDSVACRLNASSWSDADKSVLPADECDDFRAAMNRLKAVTTALGLDVLDKLAAIKPGEEDDDPYSLKTPKKFPEGLRRLIDDYYGDVYRWNRKGPHNSTLLALALLEQEDMDANDIGSIIEKTMRPDSKHGHVWTCPQCDDGSPGMVGTDRCRRCYGWGYIFGDRPDDSEYDWTDKGRAALNLGEPWTKEQEDEEAARISAEEDAYWAEKERANEPA